eukprot:5882551-Prymnesium_polylepis.1
MAWKSEWRGPLLEEEGRGLPEAAVFKVGARPCGKGAAPPRLMDKQLKSTCTRPYREDTNDTAHGKDVVVRPGSQQGEAERVSPTIIRFKGNPRPAARARRGTATTGVASCNTARDPRAPALRARHMRHTVGAPMSTPSPSAGLSFVKPVFCEAV